MLRAIVRALGRCAPRGLVVILGQIFRSSLYFSLAFAADCFLHYRAARRACRVATLRLRTAHRSSASFRSRAQCPRGLDAHVVMDNYGTHKTKLIRTPAETLVSFCAFQQLDQTLVRSGKRGHELICACTLDQDSSMLNFIGGLAHTWWVQAVFFFLSGLLVGLWFGHIEVRRVSDHDEAKRQLGYAMRDMGERVGRNTFDSVEPWPANLGISRGGLMSLFIRVSKIGLWVPSSKIFQVQNGGAFMANYLTTVGTLLADGHFAEAADIVESARQQFEALK